MTRGWTNERDKREKGLSFRCKDSFLGFLRLLMFSSHCFPSIALLLSLCIISRFLTISVIINFHFKCGKSWISSFFFIENWPKKIFFFLIKRVENYIDKYLVFYLNRKWHNMRIISSADQIKLWENKKKVFFLHTFSLTCRFKRFKSK